MRNYRQADIIGCRPCIWEYLKSGKHLQAIYLVSRGPFAFNGSLGQLQELS